MKVTFTLNSGAEHSLKVPADTYAVQTTASGSTLLSGIFTAQAETVQLAYIVGEANNNSVTLITRLTRDVF